MVREQLLPIPPNINEAARSSSDSTEVKPVGSELDEMVVRDAGFSEPVGFHAAEHLARLGWPMPDMNSETSYDAKYVRQGLVR
jgi:hypothetical protein